MRSGRGIALTPGGRRLAALATEILGLAEQARRSVAESGGETRRLSVLATPLVAEHIGPLIELFSGRDEALEITVATAAGGVVRRGARAPPRRHRARARAGRGRRDRSPPPRSCAAASSSSPRRRIRWRPRGRSRRRALAGERWLVGPPELDPGEATGQLPRPPRRWRPSASRPTAAAPPRSPPRPPARASCSCSRTPSSTRSDGARSCVLTYGERRSSRCGTPRRSASGRALPAALALQRFATTPEATQAISSGRAGAVSTTVRPKVHTTLWQSVAARGG